MCSRVTFLEARSFQEDLCNRYLRYRLDRKGVRGKNWCGAIDNETIRVTIWHAIPLLQFPGIDQLIVDMEHGAQRIINLAWDLEKQGKIEIDRGMDEETPVVATAAAAQTPRATSADVTPEGVAESEPSEPDPEA